MIKKITALALVLFSLSASTGFAATESDQQFLPGVPTPVVTVVPEDQQFLPGVPTPIVVVTSEDQGFLSDLHPLIITLPR